MISTPGFDLLSEDLEDNQEKSGRQKRRTSGEVQPDGNAVHSPLAFVRSGRHNSSEIRLRAKCPIRARTFQSRVHEHFDPETSADSSSGAVRGGETIVQAASKAAIPGRLVDRSVKLVASRPTA